MDNSARAQAIKVEAGAIVAENNAARADGHPPLPGAAAHKRLMAATAVAVEPAADYRISIEGQHGRPILSVKSVTRQGVTLHLPAGSGASDDQLKAALQTALETLRMNGVSLA